MDQGFIGSVSSSMLCACFLFVVTVSMGHENGDSKAKLRAKHTD